MASITNSRQYVDHYIETVEIDEQEKSTLPVTVQAAKDWARIDASFDDTIVEDLIKDSKKEFRKYTRSVLYETNVTVTYSFDNVGTTEFRLPYGPVDSITSVQVYGSDIDYTQKGDWILIEDHNADDVEVVYIAKRYEPADDIDSDIKIGIYKYIATNYDDRENTSMEQIYKVPDGTKMKWSDYRRMQL